MKHQVFDAVPSFTFKQPASQHLTWHTLQYSP
jgi:hypothetical protein